ncbi:MAG: L-threonylcarbamoyladenylate synthase [Victivallaceae bacterium]
MKTYSLENEPMEEIVRDCVRQLLTDETVLAVPTETVYGLVCRWNDPSGIERIYRLKERDRGKPLAMFADSIAMLEANGVVLSRDAMLLTEKFCPGPITIIVPDVCGAKTGYRIPDHPFILALLKSLGAPLASTSANLSGLPNALNVDEAVRDLSGEPDIMVDGGPIQEARQASTVVDLSGCEWRIVRNGPISELEIRETLSVK